MEEVQEHLSRLGLNSPVSKTPNKGIWDTTDGSGMTHCKGLIRVPAMRHGDSTKTMFLMMYDAPGGIWKQDTTALMASNCDSVTLTYNEAFNGLNEDIAHEE